ncbi:urease accessory protein UreE [Rhodobacteraceae bacterium]|nr:urease accessory protein UreE [Paracoccaceae bacterium]
MPDFLCQTVKTAGDWTVALGRCELNYDDRFFRRKIVTTTDNQSILVDFPQVISLNNGDALVTSDGQCIAVHAAPEDLFAVTGPNLAQLAWHIGNRHTPCQIDGDRLLILCDDVIGHMLGHLGATVTKVVEPFTPEGGAYGHGRTHSHEHGHSAHHDH